MDAAQFARLYDRYLAALWRGDNVAAFGAWLDAHWAPAEQPEPATPPAAMSPLGGGGRGIRWYETATGIVGYVPGFARACYRIPATVTPPAFAQASEALAGRFSTARLQEERSTAIRP